MLRMITLFAETTICTISFCVISLFIPTGDMHMGPTGVYLEAETNWAITIGTFGIGAAELESHERGHMIQRQEMDILYWLIVGVPSAISMNTDTPREHMNRWYELQATEYGNELYN